MGRQPTYGAPYTWLKKEEKAKIKKYGHHPVCDGCRKMEECNIPNLPNLTKFVCGEKGGLE